MRDETPLPYVLHTLGGEELELQATPEALLLACREAALPTRRAFLALQDWDLSVVRVFAWALARAAWRRDRGEPLTRARMDALITPLDLIDLSTALREAITVAGWLGKPDDADAPEPAPDASAEKNAG
jgi:hypothetical protein